MTGVPERDSRPPLADHVYALPLSPDERRRRLAKLPWIAIPMVAGLAFVPVSDSFSPLGILLILAMMFAFAWVQDRENADGLGRTRLAGIGLCLGFAMFALFVVGLIVLNATGIINLD